MQFHCHFKSDPHTLPLPGPQIILVWTRVWPFTAVPCLGPHTLTLKHNLCWSVIILFPVSTKLPRGLDVVHETSHTGLFTPALGQSSHRCSDKPWHNPRGQLYYFAYMVDNIIICQYNIRNTEYFVLRVCQVLYGPSQSWHRSNGSMIFCSAS